MHPIHHLIQILHLEQQVSENVPSVSLRINLAPKVQQYDALRDSVPPPIDQNLVYIHFRSNVTGRRRLRRNNLDVPIVELLGFGYFNDRCSARNSMPRGLQDKTQSIPAITPKQPTHKRPVCMIRTHPLLWKDRHGGQGRIQTIQVPMQITIITRNDVLPRVALCSRSRASSTFRGREGVRYGRCTTSITQDRVPVSVLEPVGLAVLLLSEATIPE